MLCGGSEHQAKFRSLFLGEVEEETSRLIDLEMLLNKPVHTYAHTYTHAHLRTRTHAHSHSCIDKARPQMSELYYK